MLKLPLLNVDARVDAQYSEYQGDVPCSVAELIDNVKILLVYPSQLQLSSSRPPLPDAHTKILPKRPLP